MHVPADQAFLMLNVLSCNRVKIQFLVDQPSLGLFLVFLREAVLDWVWAPSHLNAVVNSETKLLVRQSRKLVSGI